MYRLLGYMLGLGSFLALCACRIQPQFYYFASIVLSFGTLFLVALFRVLAGRFNGFWRIWSKRFQAYVVKALMCLGYFAQLPSFISNINSDSSSRKLLEEQQTTFRKNRRTLLQTLIYIMITPLAAFIFITCLYSYIEAIYYECQFQKSEAQRESRREELIARNTARMTLIQQYSEILDRYQQSKVIPSESTRKYPLKDSTIRKQALRVSALYPDQLSVSQMEQRALYTRFQDQQKKEKRQYSEFLSTNPSQSVPNFETKQQILESVPEKESQLQRENEQIEIDKSRLKMEDEITVGKVSKNSDQMKDQEGTGKRVKEVGLILK